INMRPRIPSGTSRATSRATSARPPEQAPAHPIGIGGRLAASPLPHHRTYGSVYGGSVDYAGLGAATEAKPSDLKKTVCKAMLSAGLAANRQGPCGLPAV